MRNSRVQVLAEIGLAVALAAVLNFWKITLPWNVAGGTISFAILPILIVAFRRGAIAGVTAGFLMGTIDLMFNPVFIHWAQVILDFQLAYVLIGLAGLGSKRYQKYAQARSSIGAVATVSVSTLLAVALSFTSHLVSGVIFFASYAPKTQNVWIYSAIYNVSWLGPSALISLLAAFIILPALQKTVPISS